MCPSPFGTVGSAIIVRDQARYSLGFGYVGMSTVKRPNWLKERCILTSDKTLHLLVIQEEDDIRGEESQQEL